MERFQKGQTGLLMVVGNIPCQVEMNHFFFFEGLDKGLDFGLPELIAVDVQVAHNSQFFHVPIIPNWTQKQFKGLFFHNLENGKAS